MFGWIILVLVIGYNFAIIVATLADLWRDCWRGGNLSVMDEIRREYYWEKINQYECENEDIERKTISKWVRLGNLNEKEEVHEKCKFIRIKV